MTDAMNPTYPPASEIADSHLSKSIDTLTETTRDGFNDVKAQMREMATKDAVNAQVARMDLRIDHVNEKVDTGLESIKRDMTEEFKKVEVRDKERDEAAEKRDAARDSKFARRMTWTLTIVGIAFTAFQVFIAPILQT